MGILPIYIFGALSNALVSSINSRKQQAAQREIAQGNLDAQQANLRMQLEHQRLLHDNGYKQQIEHQLRQYRLSNAWPLVSTPEDVSDIIKRVGNIPVYLIIAPAEASGIQKELYSLWTNFSNYIQNMFAANSETPVIPGSYKPNAQVNPNTDIILIYNGLSSVSTLYIAPYSTNRDSVLGIKIAFWGNLGNQLPQVQNFEIDIRKEYIDIIRGEAYEYRARCDRGALEWNDTDVHARNWELFEKERQLLEINGNDFQFLDNNLNFYRNVRSTNAVFLKLANKLLPFMKIFSVAILDTYFTLEYSVAPKLPACLKACKNSLPDLRFQKDDGTVEVISSENYVNDLSESYLNCIINNAGADLFKKEENIQGLIELGESVSNKFKALIEDRQSKIKALEIKSSDEDDRRNVISTAGIYYELAIKEFRNKNLDKSLKYAKEAALLGHQDALLLYNETVQVMRRHKRA